MAAGVLKVGELGVPSPWSLQSQNCSCAGVELGVEVVSLRVGDKEEDGAVVVAPSWRGVAKPGEEEEGEDEEDKDGEASMSRAGARRRGEEPVSAVSNTSWRGTSASGPNDEDLALGRSS